MIWVDDGQGGQHWVYKTEPSGEGVTRCGLLVSRPFYAVDVADNKCHVCAKAAEEVSGNVVRSGDVVTASVTKRPS